MDENILLLADSYKVSHHLQYPPNTTKILSYFESRGGKFDEVVFFGLQYVLKKWFCTPITQAMIDEASVFFQEHFSHNPDVFNRQGWQHILEKHGGKLPLIIKAVPEGQRVPVKNVLFTVENSDPEVPWLVSYVESILVQVWYPTTVCTNSFEQKRLLWNFMLTSHGDKSSLPLKLHDFGVRGASSVESAGIGGCAHLVNFSGTDNLPAIKMARKFYETTKMVGTSVPATEHSTMTTWGRQRENEAEAVKAILNNFSSGPVSVVADSYNLWNFIDKIVGEEFKEDIANRSGIFILRPDSGNPVETLIRTLNKLDKIFPSVENEQGFKVLPPFIRVIQGDGISFESLGKIIEALEEAKWSLDNVTFGSGGALLQKDIHRDTQKVAFKCCMAVINGEQVDVFKQPITDPGKQSKKGNITLVQQSNGLMTTKRREEIQDGEIDLLQEVYKNGQMVKTHTFESVRERANAFFQSQ